VVLAGLLTATVVSTGAPRRRQEQALLRARGAGQRHLIQLAAAEAVLVGIVVSAVVLAIAALVGLTMFGSPNFGAGTLTGVGWGAGSAAAGLAIAAATVLAPAWRGPRASTAAT